MPFLGENKKKEGCLRGGFHHVRELTAVARPSPDPVSRGLPRGFLRAAALCRGVPELEEITEVLEMNPLRRYGGGGQQDDHQHKVGGPRHGLLSGKI